MLAAPTTQTGLRDYSRCDDRSRSAVEEQSPHPKAARTDASIAEKVDSALWEDVLLRSTDYQKIDVGVKDGIVTLSGHVISTPNQKKVEDAARTIPGVVGVNSYLVPDDKLLWAVAGALGKIEHEYGVKFFTGLQNGVVILNGEVNSADVRGLAERCAAEVPGVRGVINAVRLPGVDLQGEDQRFLQPSIGEQIYFRDGLCGTVHKVIVNPNNRRVIAMIVRGRYPTSAQDPKFLMVGEVSTSERLVAIPVSAIRYITKSSGFLHIDSIEAAGYRDFDPSRFNTPGVDWAPPYPYCPDEILFPVETTKEPGPAFIPAIFPVPAPANRSVNI